MNKPEIDSACVTARLGLEKQRERGISGSPVKSCISEARINLGVPGDTWSPPPPTPVTEQADPDLPHLGGPLPPSLPLLLAALWLCTARSGSINAAPDFQHLL